MKLEKNLVTWGLRGKAETGMLTGERCKGTFQGDGKFCVDCGVYVGIYICQNSLNCTLKMDAFIICKLYLKV